MPMMRVGLEAFDINEDDIVLFNGECWTLLTRRIKKGVRPGNSKIFPTISRIECEHFLNENILILVDKMTEYKTESGKQMGLYYYRFDVEKLTAHLNKPCDSIVLDGYETYELIKEIANTSENELEEVFGTYELDDIILSNSLDELWNHWNTRDI